MADRRNREPRVDEAMLSDDEATTPDIDPELVSRLETWFGPLDESVQKPAAAPQMADGFWVPPEDPHRDWRRARALEAAARGSLGPRLEARGASYGALVEPLPPMELGVDPSIARLDLSVWPGPPAGGPRERMRPEDLSDAVAEQVPQAVLRDLHRPVPEVGPIELERLELVGETGTRPMEMVRDIIDTRYRADLQALADTPRQIRESMAEMRHRIDDEPWAEAKPEKPSSFPDFNTADLMKWFAQ